VLRGFAVLNNVTYNEEGKLLQVYLTLLVTHLAEKDLRILLNILLQLPDYSIDLWYTRLVLGALVNLSYWRQTAELISFS
jgi:hypothetical protein